jgi:predicted permease
VKNFFNQTAQDARYALRQLRKSPGFAITAIVTLALGIGATTAIFTLVHAVLLKSLPVTRPDELYRIGKKVHCCQWGGFTQWEEFSLFNNELYHRFRDNTPAFVDLAAFQGGSIGLGVRRTGTSQDAETRNGQFVSGNFFRTFQWQMSHYADLTMQDKEYLPKQEFHLTPGGAGVTDLREQYEADLRLLMVAAGCVLLIACANLANLLLARGLRNRQQTSVRVALGASRGRLVGKALVESVLLGLLGGAAGLGVAYAGTSLILHLAFSGPNSYVPIEAAPSWPVLLFALGVSVLTGACFGIAPAWMTSHAEPIEALRGANRSTGRGARWPQRALVVGQAALSLVLISAAALLSQSLRNLEHQNFGFTPEDHYLAYIDPHLAGYQPGQLELLYRRVFDRLRSIPGVQGVAAATYAPMSGDSWNEGVRVQGKPEPHSGQDDGATWTRVTPGFFETLNNRILVGRSFTEQDTATSPLVAVVNEAFAKKFLSGENPIGKQFGMDEMARAGDFEIVGVAADMRYLTYGLKDPDRPMFFLPATQHIPWTKPNQIAGESASHYLGSLVFWVPGKPEALEGQVRRALSEIDPNLVLVDFASYREILHRDFDQQGMIAKLTTLFGALALVLAAVGLYGVSAYTVEQRTSEIGIRMALGADRKSVLGMVLRGAFLQVGVGLAIGIPAAIAAGHAMTTQLYSVKPYDPGVLALATCLLGVAALLAAAIPAQRAASVNPTDALRSE